MQPSQHLHLHLLQPAAILSSHPQASLALYITGMPSLSLSTVTALGRATQLDLHLPLTVLDVIKIQVLHSASYPEM